MEITHMTYTLVDQGVEPPFPSLKPVAQVVDFLGEHVRLFLSRATGVDAPPPGRFSDTGRQSLFRSLHMGGTQEFLRAAHELAHGLVRAMNGVTAPGLLVALRAEGTAGGMVAGVLKLQVATPNGAALREAESGEVRLEAVKDMLEQPGRLQKAALVTSTLPDERVICGDQFPVQARYFPDALGIIVHPRPRLAAKTFFDVVDEVDPALTGQVAEVMKGCRPGPVTQVLAEIGRKLPELTTRAQADIAQRLTEQPHPVFELDTNRVIKERYEIGGIVLSGARADMRHTVQKERGGDGRWRLIIEADDEPRGIRT